MTKSMESKINMLKKQKCWDHIIHIRYLCTFKQHFISNPKFDRDPADVKNGTFFFSKKKIKKFFKIKSAFFKSG